MRTSALFALALVAAAAMTTRVQSQDYTFSEEYSENPNWDQDASWENEGEEDASAASEEAAPPPAPVEEQRWKIVFDAELAPCTYRNAHWHTAMEVMQLVEGPDTIISYTYNGFDLSAKHMQKCSFDNDFCEDSKNAVYSPAHVHLQYNPSCETAFLKVAFDADEWETLSLPRANDFMSYANNYNEQAYGMPENTFFPKSSWPLVIDPKCANFCALTCEVPEGRKPNELECRAEGDAFRQQNG